MPSNEQIIEVARRKLGSDPVDHIRSRLNADLTVHEYVVVFKTRGTWIVKPDEAEAVTLEPKHADEIKKYDWNDLEEARARAYEKGYENAQKFPLEQQNEWKNELCMVCLKQVPHNHAVCFDCAGKPGLEPVAVHGMNSCRNATCPVCAAAYSNALSITSLKQYHKHDKDECAECMKLAVFQFETGYKDGVEQGKALLKQFDREALGNLLERRSTMFSFAPKELANVIADEFAAPGSPSEFDIQKVASLVESRMLGTIDISGKNALTRDLILKVFREFKAKTSQLDISSSKNALLRIDMFNPDIVLDLDKASA